MKRNLLLYLFTGLFCVTSKASLIRSVCETRPNYDIVVTSLSVQFIEKEEVIELLKNGQVKHNLRDVIINDTLSEKNAKLYEYIVTELPRFKLQLIKELANTHHYFNQVIRKRFANSAPWLNYLHRLHDRLKLALDQTIVTQPGRLVFNQKAFNEINVKIQTISNELFSFAMSDRSNNLEFIKNYAAISEIVNKKWNDEKPKLTGLHTKGCDIIKYIDGQYHAIKAQIKVSTR